MYRVALDESITSEQQIAGSNSDGSRDGTHSHPLTKAVDVLLSRPHCTESSESLIERINSLDEIVTTQLGEIDKRHCSDAMLDVQYALFLLQQVHFVAASDHRAYFQFNPVVVWLRERLQDWWIETEERQLAQLNLPPCDSIGALKQACLGHSGAQHELFDFLEKDATTEQLVAFFESDAQLNTRFFDLLIFCLVGTDGTAKAELAQNLWDEAGRGDPQAAHVAMFEEILAEKGVSAQWRDGSNLDWQGLAGHNLFVALCVGRKHQYKALGLMAATELIDPASYTKLANGCRRLGIGVPAYYSEHIEVDVVHGEGWLENVIAPLIQRVPHSGLHIMLGAALRMSSCQRYYDQVLLKLRKVAR